MPDPAFRVSRRGPNLLEVINGGAVFAIMRNPDIPDKLHCCYGGASEGVDSVIRWGQMPIAIRRAARFHFELGATNAS